MQSIKSTEKYLEDNVCAHGFPMSDDWFFISPQSIPTVKFHTPVNIQLITDDLFHVQIKLYVLLVFTFNSATCTKSILKFSHSGP